MNNNFKRTTEMEEWSGIIRRTEEDFRAIVSGNVPADEVVEYAQELAGYAAGYPENDRLNGCLFLGVAEDIRGIPNDCFCEYVLRTTITGLSIIVYAKQHYAEADISDEVVKGLMRGARRNGFQDHGYDTEPGLIRNLTVMMMAGMDSYLQAYPELEPEFTERFGRACETICERERDGEYLPAFSSREEVSADRRTLIDLCEGKKKVFVYGTLLSGNSNHDYYLKESTLEGEAELDGYTMYDLGYYPGIQRTEGGKVKGELYTVEEEKMEALDMLEGRGSLYDAVIENIHWNGVIVPAWVYVYKNELSGRMPVPYDMQPWKKVM